MRYLLDTDHCVALLRRHPLVMARFATLAQEDELYLSIISVAELFYGAALTQDPQQEVARITTLVERVAVLELDLEAAKHYGRLKADLRRRGVLIEDNDLYIASVALRHGLTLLTHNQEHYARIQELPLIDWLRAP